MRPEERLSESFSSPDWELGQRELMFLSLNVDPLFIHGLVLMERIRASGGFAKKRMRMTEMVVFDVPIQASRIELSGVEQLVSTPEKMRRLDEPAWLHLVESVKKARPGDASAIDDLIASRDREQRLLGGSNRFDRLNEQRDGIGLSLDIAGIGREQLFRTIRADRAGAANSILDVLGALRHRRMSHDIWRCPLGLSGRSRYIGHCLTQFFIEGTGKYEGQI